jgi:hypothetical protein
VRRSKRPFPWLPLALLVLSAGVFWALPALMGERPVQVRFEEAAE